MPAANTVSALSYGQGKISYDEFTYIFARFELLPDSEISGFYDACQEIF